VRRGQGQGAARERRAVLGETASEVREEKLRRGRLARGVDEPGEGRTKLHQAIIGWARLRCHQRFVSGGGDYSTKRLIFLARGLIVRPILNRAPRFVSI